MIESNHIGKIMKDVLEQKEALILEQLNDFIKRGLIEIHETEPMFVQSHDLNKVELRQSVRLVLKDKEYIEKLERENSFYREQIADLKEWLSARLIEKPHPTKELPRE